MEKVESYFQSALAPESFHPSGAPLARIIRSYLPPIYLQQPGHSLTVVGLERLIDGCCNIIVLDPMYHSSRAMCQLIDVGPRAVRRYQSRVMGVYRRGTRQLGPYSGFELVM